MNEEKEVGSYRPRSRFESFFAYFFCGEKKYESVKQGSNILTKAPNAQNNKLNIKN